MWLPYNHSPMSTEVLRVIPPNEPRLNLYNLLDVSYIVLLQEVTVLTRRTKFHCYITKITMHQSAPRIVILKTHKKNQSNTFCTVCVRISQALFLIGNA